MINCSLKLQTFFFLPTQTHFLVHYQETDAEGNVKVDSTKMYRDVEIKFRGTDYDKYTVNMYESN